MLEGRFEIGSPLSYPNILIALQHKLPNVLNWKREFLPNAVLRKYIYINITIHKRIFLVSTHLVSFIILTIGR